MTVQDRGSPFSSSNNDRSSEKAWAQKMKQVPAAASSKKYESRPPFIDSCTHCWACHSSIHSTSKYRNLNEDSHIVKAENWRYQDPFWMERVHRGQEPHPVGHNTPPPPWHQSSSRTLNKNFYTKRAQCVICARLLYMVKPSVFEGPV